MDIKDMIEKKGDGSKELKVIGAGLSRTGTLSTRYTCTSLEKNVHIAVEVFLRAVLEELLGGACYHGVVPVVERVIFSPILIKH